MLTVLLHSAFAERVAGHRILCLLFPSCYGYEPQFPTSLPWPGITCSLCSFMLWDFAVLLVVAVYLSPLATRWSPVFPFPYRAVVGTAVLWEVVILTMAVTCSHTEKCLLQGPSCTHTCIVAVWRKLALQYSVSSHFHSVLFYSVPLDRCSIQNGILEYTFTFSSSV